MPVSQEYLDKLTTERNRAWEEQKATLDAAVKEGRALSAEEREKVARIDEAIDAYDAEIKSWLDRDKREAEAAQARAEYEHIVHPDVTDRRDRQADEDIAAFLRGERGRALDIDFRAVANEKRALRAGATGREFRDLVVGTAGAGGNTVPTGFVRQLYDFLEIFSGMRRTNATIITTTGGESLEFPKVTLHGTAAIVGEGSALAENDPQFAKMTLGSWKYGQLLQMSNELISDSGVDIVGFAARDMGRALARVTDTAYVTGSGSNEPTGLMTVIGTAVTGANGATGQPSFDDLIDVVYSVNEEYRANGAQWLMRDATAGAVRKLKDDNGQYLWQPSVQAGQPDRLLNYPVVTDPNVAAIGTGVLPIAFGDFSAFYIRDVGSVRIERSDDFAFSSDMVTWRAILRTDSDLIDLTGAIKAYRGGTA